MKRLAGEDLGYEKALKYFTPEEMKNAVEETIGRELQDSDIFSDLAEEKDAKSITVEDMIDFASDDFEFKDNFMYDLMAVAKFNDDENLANEAEDQSFDVIDIIDTVINKNADVKKKLEADLKVTYSMYLHNNSEAEGISDVKELSDNDDKVGDTISCSKDFDIDLGNRDSAFLYMRGGIIVGNKNETHSDLINKYFKNENVPRKRIRSVDSVDDLEAGEPIAFGHIMDGIAFIQTLENCDESEVVNALKKKGNYKKIYDYDFEVPSLKRLAKEELNNINDLIQKENCSDSVIETIAENIDMAFEGMGNAEELKSIYDKNDGLTIVDIYAIFNKMIKNGGLGNLILSNLNLDDKYSCGANFDNSIKGFVENNKTNPQFAKVVSKIENAIGLEEKNNNSDDTSEINNAEDLLNSDDEVGETTKTTSKFSVDGHNRDYPYLYINGDVVFGYNSGDTHTSLLNRYFKTKDYGNERVRTIKQVKELEGNEPCSFGHIVNNMAFIQTTENCALDDVVKALKEADNKLVKIYDYQFSKSQVKRLAKKRW